MLELILVVAIFIGTILYIVRDIAAAH